MPIDADKALLPAGFADLLPEEATLEAETLARLMRAFTQRGYERIKPPLIEFEDGLLEGTGAAMSGQTFRLMDPESQRMMGLRADMTPQIARVATSRLAHRPRPLRLCYAGDVLRVKGGQLRPERQFAQAGVELLGSAAPDADAEVIATAVEALAEIGLADVAVDLGMPTLVPAVMADLEIPEQVAVRLRTALDRKDAAATADAASQAGSAAATLLPALMAAAGPVEPALARLMALDLGPRGQEERARFVAVVERVTARLPQTSLTLDPVENRGFEYHSGVIFTLFAHGVRGELGTGGRYVAGGDGAAEPATGFSLFLDTLLRAVPTPDEPQRVLVPVGTDAERLAALRAEGWVTVPALEPATDLAAEARRLGIRHVLETGAEAPQPIPEEGSSR